MGLAVEHRQPFLTVQRLRLHAQPLEIAQDVRLHPFQPGPGCGKVIRRDAEGEILGAVNAVVAFGDLPLSISVNSARMLSKASWAGGMLI